jgi:putative two-component system response regulator
MPDSDPLPPATATLLIVDDVRENLVVLGQLLRPHYRVRVANSGQRALEAAASEPRPDLILLDVMMPGMDGYTVLARLRERPATADIPVIFVTAMDADEDEQRGLDLGAVDYVTKPIKPALLLARVHAQLELKRARDGLAAQNAQLDAEVHRRMLENELVKEASLHALALLAEKRDNETGNHLHRTQSYVAALIRRLRPHPRFQAALANAVDCQRIVKAAPLHDIGKVGIPDAILLKPGPLTPDEFEIMKTHAEIGRAALQEAVDRVRERFPEGSSAATQALAFLDTAMEIAGGHHERWDGSGYPLGLAGEAIPLAARLMALADVFDALVSRRHYKAAFPLAQTLAIIRDGRGSQFDPDVVDAFLAGVDEFVEISRRFGDAPAPEPSP